MYFIITTARCGGKMQADGHYSLLITQCKLLQVTMNIIKELLCNVCIPTALAHLMTFQVALSKACWRWMRNNASYWPKLVIHTQVSSNNIEVTNSKTTWEPFLLHYIYTL